MQRVGFLKQFLGVQRHWWNYYRVAKDAVNWQWLKLSETRFCEFSEYIIVPRNPERCYSFIYMKRSEERDLQLRLPQATHSWLNFPSRGNVKVVVVTGYWWIMCYFEVTCEVLLNDWLTEINYSVRTVMEVRWRTLINAKPKAIPINALMFFFTLNKSGRIHRAFMVFSVLTFFIL